MTPVEAERGRPQLMTCREVAALCRVSTRQVWRLVAMAAMPAPVKLSTRCARWREREIVAWLDGDGQRATA